MSEESHNKNPTTIREMMDHDVFSAAGTKECILSFRPLKKKWYEQIADWFKK